MTPFCLLSLCLMCCLVTAAVGQTSSTASQQFADLGEVKLENGAVIHGCKLGYRTLGQLNDARSNVVLYPTWYTGTSKDLLATISAHGFIDPGSYFFILVDSLGGGCLLFSIEQQGPARGRLSPRSIYWTWSRPSTAY